MDGADVTFGGSRVDCYGPGRERKIDVAIVGGGIGGLAAALAFRRVGIEAEVFEQAPELKEVGAGIQIGPNTVRLL